MNRTRFALLTAMVLAAAASRLLPHAPNFTPIAALAVFGVATFDDVRAAYVVPLLGLFASDCALGFYPGMAVVYGSFVLVGSLGYFLRRRRTVARTVAVTLAGAGAFFAITNFAVWAQGQLYPQTAAGLLACYVAAIPFLRNTLSSDLLYSLLLFGALACAERWWPALRAPVRRGLATVSLSI